MLGVIVAIQNTGGYSSLVNIILSPGLPNVAKRLLLGKYFIDAGIGIRSSFFAYSCLTSPF
jgi:hypothetical protein